jgi:hypothetical protein
MFMALLRWAFFAFNKNINILYERHIICMLVGSVGG